MFEALSYQCRTDLEHHRLVGRDGQGNGSREMFKGFGYPVGDGRRHQGIEPLGQLQSDIFGLVGIRIRRHVWPVRFCGAGGNDHRAICAQSPRPLPSAS